MSRFILVAMALVFLLPAVDARALISNVTSADQICAPTADPCVIDQEVQVANDVSVTLDFGQRTVAIVPNGLLNTGSGLATVLCGSFDVSVGNGLAIKARGPNGTGGSDGGILEIRARRQCSLDTARSCLGDSECSFGACTAKLCGGDLTRLCITDADCQLGICSLGGTCVNDASHACGSDADCQLGTCTVLTCSKDRTIQCAADADCDFGTCSVGSGTISLDGTVRADGVTPGSVTLIGAGDIAVRQSINLVGTSPDSDGGSLDVQSALGTISIDGPVTVSSGGQGGGGDVSLFAKSDVIVTTAVDVTGGDFDGGLLEIEAGRDVIISASLLADSTTAGGFGGDVLVTAGRDIQMNGSAEIGADGHRSSIDGFGGDGGSQELTAGRDVIIGSLSSLHADGAAPDGFGGDISVDAGGDLSIQGRLVVRARGRRGSGGSADLSSAGSLQVGPGSVIDVSGSSAGGGDATLASDGDLTMAGTIDGSVSNGGIASGLSLDSGGNATIAGTIRNGGIAGLGFSGLIDIEACDIMFAAPAVIQNDAETARNVVTSHEQVTVSNGSQVIASPPSGSNQIIYRVKKKFPIIEGTVNPSPQLTQNTSLTSCSATGSTSTTSTTMTTMTTVTTTTTTLSASSCGNGVVEGAEECDDGDTLWQSGQFCDATCNMVNCGDPDNTGSVTASDALFVLRVAVGANTCDACVCNVDSSTSGRPVSASDALRLLRAAVGQPIQLTCPPCL